MTDTLDPQFWDEFYRSREQLFSGRPNGALVDEAAALAPGRALDLGCGEGADAHWLAERGWQVTAVDLAEVALQRAAAADHPAITWQRADLRARLHRPRRSRSSRPSTSRFPASSAPTRCAA